MCVEARKQRTVLHCEKTDVTVHGCMGSDAGATGLDMMYVHRSFAISPRHVASLEKRDLVMDNGLVIEIPTKRLSQVKELFG
ncbi:MAG: LytTR family transcriptional regulator DNA-binding domain-containing protein [Eggerthellaceae bacterium]